MYHNNFPNVSQTQVQEYVRKGRQLQAEAVASSFRKLTSSLFRK